MISTQKLSRSFKDATGFGLSHLVWVGYLMLVAVSLAMVKINPLVALLLAGGGSIVVGWKIGRDFEINAASRHITVIASGTAMLWHWVAVVILCVNYAWFFVKDAPPAAGILLLGGVLLLRWRFTGQLFAFTPLNMPLVGLLAVAIASGMIFSVEPVATYRNVYGLVLGVLFFFEVVYGLQQSANLLIWLIGLQAIGLGIVGIGLLGVESLPNELFNASALQQFMPRLPLDLKHSTGGFHPNTLGGTIIYLIPLYAVMLTGNFFAKLKYRRLLTGLTAITFSSSIFLLILTQSRGALMGIVIAGVALFFALKQQYRLSLSIVILSMAILILLFFFGYFSWLVDILGISQSSAVNLTSYTVRQSFWELGLKVWQTFPIIGIGIGAFDFVARTHFFEQYPQWILQEPGGWFPHVHNELLQTAIDLGVLGITAFVALLAGVVRAAWRAFTLTTDPNIRHLILSLMAGLLAHQVFGLTDVLYLGSKPGVIFWMMVGLVTAIYLRALPTVPNRYV